MAAAFHRRRLLFGFLVLHWKTTIGCFHCLIQEVTKMKRTAWESILLHVFTCVAAFVLLWAFLALLEGVLFWPVALGTMFLSLLVLNALCGVFLRQPEPIPGNTSARSDDIAADPLPAHPAVQTKILHRTAHPRFRIVQGGRVA